jgi:L-ascorbate metabolism protein UlaG (beta-lactamase superfamily)
MKPTAVNSTIWALALAVGAVGQWCHAEDAGKFILVQRLPNQDVALEFTAPAGEVWRVETSGDLADWQGWICFKSRGANRHLDSAGAYHERRFYRATEVAAAGSITGDHLATANGEVVIHPVNHASLVLGWNGRAIYVDPVGGAGLYQGLPGADLVLLTHQHGDHLHVGTLDSVRGPQVVIVAPQTAYNGLSAGLKGLTKVLANGAQTNLLDLTVEAVPAYNLTASHHAKGAGNGYVLTLGGKRIYISGDTEDTREMRALRDVDVAFVAMNTPYTMTVAKAVSAVREFRPKVVYPYHFRNQDGSYADLDAFQSGVGTDLGIEVRRRNWY